MKALICLMVMLATSIVYAGDKEDLARFKASFEVRNQQSAQIQNQILKLQDQLRIIETDKIGLISVIAYLENRIKAEGEMKGKAEKEGRKKNADK